MTEIQAKKHLQNMLKRLTPGSVVHLLGEVIRASEQARHGELDEAALERVSQAEAALFVFGCGLDSVLPR